MKKFKKALASTLAVLSAASALCVPMGASATYADSDNGLYVKTSVVPEDVVSYATNAFSSYSYNDMLNLDFDGETVENVRLSKPFTVKTFDVSSDDYTQYYFPVVNNDNVEAVLTVNVNIDDNSMSYQLGKDMMTFALENAVSSSSNPITVCANEDCYFSVDSDGNADVLYDFDTTDNKDLPVEIDMNRFTDTDTVHIGSDNVYSDTLSGWNNARAIMGIKLPVQYVANVGANCWAACFGCLSTYYTNTNTGGSVQDGENMRNIAMNTYSSGGKTQVKELLSKYNNVSMTIVNNILSWDTIKTEISTRSPFYTSWVRTGGRHALVVSGYTYNNVTNGEKKIYAMDPNVGTNVSISYGSTCTYSPSTSRTYTWESTLYRA